MKIISTFEKKERGWLPMGEGGGPFGAQNSPYILSSSSSHTWKWVFESFLNQFTNLPISSKPISQFPLPPFVAHLGYQSFSRIQSCLWCSFLTAVTFNLLALLGLNLYCFFVANKNVKLVSNFFFLLQIFLSFFFLFFWIPFEI